MPMRTRAWLSPATAQKVVDMKFILETIPARRSIETKLGMHNGTNNGYIVSSFRYAHAGHFLDFLTIQIFKAIFRLKLAEIGESVLYESCSA